MSQAAGSSERSSLLLDAAETGSIDDTLKLLDEGVSAFSVDDSGYTALHKCAFMGYDQLAAVLIEREPHLIDACDITFNTPLHVAAFSGHIFMAAALLDAGANVSAADLAGNTPLHRAVLEGQLGTRVRPRRQQRCHAPSHFILTSLLARTRAQA